MVISAVFGAGELIEITGLSMLSKILLFLLFHVVPIMIYEYIHKNIKTLQSTFRGVLYFMDTL